MTHGLAIRAAAGLLLAATSVAAQDGGIEPTFFSGAGIHALGLGGAVTATTEDPSALTWNPAGLAGVTQGRFQAAHTNLFGFGFSEQYAAFAYPSWRYGVGAITFRQLGTSGIDARDDRNLVVDDDLSAGETELRFGYGRAVGSSFRVGASLNVYRQSVAGFRATGMGLDAGTQLRPLAALGSTSILAERVRMGAVLKNLVRPSIRLDQDSVRDPQGVRVGLAYDHLVPTGRRYTASLDVTKSENTDAQLRGALELRLVDLVALRGSVGSGGFTAGSGVNWSGVTFDYAFEGNDLGSIHRFGVDWSFGATVDERRSAFAAARDAELNSRLARAFEQRQQSRVDELIKTAEAALSRREPDAALRSLSMADVIAPDHERVLELQASALLVKGLDQERSGDPTTAVVTLTRAVALDPENGMAADALRRVRAESDRRAQRSNEIRALYSQALDNFVSEDLTAAQADLARVLALAPQDAEARSMMNRVREAMSNRADRLIDQARLMIDAKAFDDAETTLAEARRMDAGATGLDAATASLRAARRNEELAQAVVETPADTAPEPAADPKPEPLTAAQRAEVEDLYQKGLDAVQSRRHDEAIRYWEIVWAMAPEHQQVAEFLKREYVNRGMDRFASGRLREAVSDWENALRIDPADQRAAGYLERAREQLARYEEIVTESNGVKR